MPTPEENVATLVNLLHAVPGADTLAQLRQAMPCGLSDLTSWTSRQPDASVRVATAAVAHDLTVAGALATIPPDSIAALSELNTLDPGDPRIPEFQAQIAAAWPAREVLQQASELFDCMTSTLKQLLTAVQSQNAPANLKTATQEISDKLGNPADIAASLSFPGLLNALIGYAPGGPPPELGEVQAVAAVSAPQINTAFHVDGHVTADDAVRHFTLPDAAGDCFVQSRLVGPGDPGTAAAGLTGYLYRIDLTAAASGSGVQRLVISTGTLDGVPWPGALDATTTIAPWFTITAGGTGSQAPSEIRQIGHLTTLTFSPPLPAGTSSYFMGTASAHAAVSTPVTVYPTAGNGISIDLRAPRAAH